jgi:hypothetical protein
MVMACTRPVCSRAERGAVCVWESFLVTGPYTLAVHTADLLVCTSSNGSQTEPARLAVHDCIIGGWRSQT